MYIIIQSTTQFASSTLLATGAFSVHSGYANFLCEFRHLIRACDYKAYAPNRPRLVTWQVKQPVHFRCTAAMQTSCVNFAISSSYFPQRKISVESICYQ